MDILLVEDDKSFGYILKAYLEMNDFSVEWVKNGSTALENLSKFAYRLCILDIMLPDKDGFEIATEIKKSGMNLPFIFLTAKALKVDKLKGYKLGCDEYVTKPVEEELLLAKIQAILKRSRKNAPFSSAEIVQIGNYHFDFQRQLLQKGNNKTQLTNKETQLLKLFYDNRNQLVSRAEALKLLWGKNDMFNRKTMDVFIFKLRQYFKEDSGVRITNVHGKGFVLELDRMTRFLQDGTG